jgi:hypothetical protein
MQDNGNSKDKSMLLALLLFLGAAGLIFAYLGQSPTDQPKSNIVKSAAYEKTVNRHLMSTNDRINFEQQKAQLEAAKLLGKGAKALNPQDAYQNDNSLDLNHDHNAQDIANELGRGERKAASFESPDDVIQSEVMNQQQMREYSDEYKREYARQFIENARRGGYKLVLSDDFSRVISVTPIKKQNGLNLFESGSRGSSKPLQ